ncbi:MAG TPA: glycogen debranching N-terminal domain-containing protein [Pseudonocardiaceae bacterium]
MQPALHDLVTCVRAPAVVLSAADGQVRPGGAQGLLVGETRLLSRLELTAGGEPPTGVGYRLDGPSGCVFTAVLRGHGDPIADPTVRLVRTRTATTNGLIEHVRLVNDARVPVRLILDLAAESDHQPIGAVKHGEPGTPRPATVVPGGAGWRHRGRTLELTAVPAPAVTLGPAGATLSWHLDLPPRSTWDLTLTARAGGIAVPFPPPTAAWPGTALAVRSADAELGRLVARGTADLDALRLADPRHPDDVFLAAGSPWYLTLFGRDSLWAARMLLPLDTGLAAGTLRTLARRQGRATDPVTGEQPGKILHEVREDAGVNLPPVYYGTIDATALWVSLLHDAWRWGLDAAEVADLRTPLRAALDWIAGHDGFLAYLDESGTGLANQGWKDSGDSIQWPDGRLADPPIALCEAQAYAHRAALDGAALLAAVGEDGTPYLRWAEGLRTRFHDRFWVRDEHGPFPAIALDGHGEPVAAATSNLGHLLGSGLLDEAGTAHVAARLARPDLDCGLGLRTMGEHAAGFNPLGYHAGSVWPHDTAIAVGGLADTGHGAAAASLARGLLRAAAPFGHRVPELYGADPHATGAVTVAYPAACRPQAWSAAAAVAVLRAALGLRADVPAGELHVAPDPAFAPWFPMHVDGLRVAGHPLALAVTADGHVTATTTAPIHVHHP